MTSVLLVDDHKIVRDSLHVLIESDARFRVLGEASRGAEVMDLVRSLRPDVVMMDITLPDDRGQDITRRILAERPGTRILAMSMHTDQRNVLDMLQAGAKGYLVKDSAREELLRALDEVLAGRYYVSPMIGRVVLDAYLRDYRSMNDNAFSLLTEREREIVQLIAEGNQQGEIAAALNVSGRTVEKHRLNVLRKLDLTTIPQLTKYAVREGLTSLEI